MRFGDESSEFFLELPLTPLGLILESLEHASPGSEAEKKKKYWNGVQDPSSIGQELMTTQPPSVFQSQENRKEAGGVFIKIIMGPGRPRRRHSPLAGIRGVSTDPGRD